MVANDMEPLGHALALIEQAQQLEQDILNALTDGDSTTAEHYTVQRQQLIESIPFDQFTEGMPDVLRQALQKLHQSNSELSTLTEQVRREIEHQLNHVQKGKAGSKVYQAINNDK